MRSRKKVSVKQMLLASSAGVPSAILRGGGDVEAVRAEWRQWGDEYGFRFRVLEHLITNSDVVELARLVGEPFDEEHPNVSVLRARFDEMVDRLPEEWFDQDDPPPPPGWDEAA